MIDLPATRHQVSQNPLRIILGSNGLHHGQVDLRIPLKHVLPLIRIIKVQVRSPEPFGIQLRIDILVDLRQKGVNGFVVRRTRPHQTLLDPDIRRLAGVDSHRPRPSDADEALRDGHHGDAAEEVGDVREAQLRRVEPGVVHELHGLPAREQRDGEEGVAHAVDGLDALVVLERPPVHRARLDGVLQGGEDRGGEVPEGGRAGVVAVVELEVAVRQQALGRGLAPADGRDDGGFCVLRAVHGEGVDGVEPLVAHSRPVHDVADAHHWGVVCLEVEGGNKCKGVSASAQSPEEVGVLVVSGGFNDFSATQNTLQKSASCRMDA